MLGDISAGVFIMIQIMPESGVWIVNEYSFDIDSSPGIFFIFFLKK